MFGRLTKFPIPNLRSESAVQIGSLEAVCLSKDAALPIAPKDHPYYLALRQAAEVQGQGRRSRADAS